MWRGKPTVIITSGEHYGAVLNLDFDYRKYLDTLERDGLNGTRTWAGAYVETEGNFNIARNTLNPAPGRFICPWARSGEPGYGDGGNKFDLSRWDEAYFRRLRDFVAYAGEKGVIVELNLFCPMYDDSMWRVCPMNAANNVNGLGAVGRNDVLTLDRSGGLLAVQEAMVRKLAAELRDFDNVYFEVINEPYTRGVPLDWQRHMTDVLVMAMKDWPHPFLISWNIANGSAKVEAPHPAVSIFNFHYATPSDTVAMNWHLNRVIGDNETGFHGTGDAPYRMEAWDFLLAGGALFNHLDYSFTVGHEDGTFVFPATQPGGGGAAIRRQLRILRDFFCGFDFVRMRPDDAVVRGGAPPGGTARAFAEPGRAYAIYVRRSASTGSFSVRWTGSIEPRHSEEYRFHTFSNDGVRLWVDQKLVVDNWTDHSEREDTGAIRLEARRKVLLRLEYFYNGGQGAMKLWWSSPSEPKAPVPAAALSLPDGSGAGLKGEYFRGNDLKRPWARRTDPNVDFAWGTAAPFPVQAAAGETVLELELPAGSWVAEWVDTKTGAVAKREVIEHAGGVVRVGAPAFEEDVALRVRRAL
jgi:hypothetical protein